MKVGSLFAGIGGFDLAATRVFGSESVRWQVEIDPWARRVLAKHWPDVPKFGDIREITGDELEPVGIVCGGFPCQPFSLAGERAGQEDDRYLWPEMLRLIQVVQPTWVVGENVPGIDGLALDSVLADLEASGYEVAPPLEIPACALNAWHVRQRVWILGYSEGARGRTRARGMVQGARAALRDAQGEGHVIRRTGGDQRQLGGDGQGGGARAIAHSESIRRGSRRPGRLAGDCEGSPELTHRRPAGDELRTPTWDAEPRVGRVAHGLPRQVDRVRGLGNAIVPAVAEQLFRWIQEAEAHR